MFALRELTMNSKLSVYSDIVEILLNHSPNIELSLDGCLSNFNLDELIRLKNLKLLGNIMKDFNYDIFKNLCNKLIVLTIGCPNIENEMLIKMFNGLHFSNLSNFFIRSDKKLIH